MPEVSAKLAVLSGPTAGAEFPLSADTVTIGRGGDCDIVIDDKSMSRKHARIEPTDGGFLVIDLKSQNGTHIDGARIDQQVVPIGGRVMFGKIACEFRLPSVADVLGPQLPATMPPGEQWSNLPAVAKPMTTDDLFGLAGAAAITPQDAAKKEEATKRRNLILYIASLMAVIAVGAVMYFGIGGAEPAPARGLIIEVGEERLVGVSSAVAARGWYDEVDGIRIRDNDIISAEPDSEIRWIIAVKGMSPGISEVKLMNGDTTVCVITVAVHGKLRGRTVDIVLSDDECIAKAQAYMNEARIARNERPWLALKRYEAAFELVRHFGSSQPVRKAARKGMLDVKKDINKSYEKLKDDYRNAADGDMWDNAVRRLQEIKDLVPDSGDRRHQRAVLLLTNAHRRLERTRRRYSIK